MRYQRHVGGRHLIIPQAIGSDPGKLLSLARSHDALPAPAHIERHEKMKVRICVAREGEWSEARLCDRDPRFLPELAGERLFRPLARFHFAARELPQPRHRAPSGALRKQNAPVGIDQRAGGDQNKLHAAEPSGKCLEGVSVKRNWYGARPFSCVIPAKAGIQYTGASPGLLDCPVKAGNDSGKALALMTGSRR